MNVVRPSRSSLSVLSPLLFGRVLVVVRARLREATRRHQVGRGGGVRRGGGGRRGGRRGAALRGGQRGVHRRPRRLVGRRVRVAAGVVEGRVARAAVEVGRVGRGGAAGGRVVAGPVGGRGGRVHGAARRLGLRGPVVRGRHVRVRPARLARREVALRVQLDRPPEALAGVLRDAQDGALAEPHLGGQQEVAELVREHLDRVEVLVYRWLKQKRTNL